MQISILTQKKKQVVDITDVIEEYLQQSGKEQGACMAFVLHTTACITTADLDPGTDLDMLDAFEAIMPKLSYRHPHNPKHVTDHILSSIIGPSLTFAYKQNQIILGTWQRVVLIELDGPRTRQILLTYI